MKTKLLLTLCLLLSIGSIKAQDYLLSYNFTSYAPFGVTFGYMPYDFGGYVSCKFGSSSAGTKCQLSSIDQIVGTSDYEKLGTARQSYSGGIMVGLNRAVALYGGIGYGTYGRCWGYTKGSDDKEDVYLCSDRFAGPELELGLLYRGDEYFLGLGGIAMKGTNVKRNALLLDISIQIGMLF